MFIISEATSKAIGTLILSILFIILADKDV
jgi:hypothetical protein